MTRNIVVHIGFSKTGTTTLQHHLFANHDQIEYLGKPFPNDLFKDEFYKLITEESTVYDPSALKEYMAEHLAENILPDSKKVLLLSDEILVSYSKVRDRGIVAQRLKELLGDCKILITIRNQLEILKTAYLSRGRMLTNVPLKYSGLFITFQDWLEISYNNPRTSYIGHVDYFKTINYYSRVFGKDKVCILLLEEFIENRDGYIKKLSDFLGIGFQEAMDRVGNHHDHQDMPQAQLDFERFKSRFYPLTRVPLFGILLKPYHFFKKNKYKEKRAELQMSGKWHECLSDFYKEGNRKLIQDYQLPLKMHNYPL